MTATRRPPLSRKQEDLERARANGRATAAAAEAELTAMPKERRPRKDEELPPDMNERAFEERLLAECAR